MTAAIEETYGRLMLANLFTQVWIGDWEGYEKTFSSIPEEIKVEFPFHSHYNREEVPMWHENQFSIPGDYFISPYMSSYYGKDEEEVDKAKQDLLCLIGMFEEMGFYYPLDKGEYPDHIGSLTAFLTAAIQEEAEALKAEDIEKAEKLRNLQKETYEKYMKPGLAKLEQVVEKRASHPFIKKFVPFYCTALETSVL